MVGPVSSSGASPEPLGFPGDITKEALSSIPVKPGDEKLLQTGFGKWFASMPGASSQDQETLIRQTKAFLNQYCRDITREMKRQDARMKEALRKLKNVAEGRDPDE